MFVNVSLHAVIGIDTQNPFISCYRPLESMEPPTSDRIAFTMFKKYIDAKSGVNYSQLAMHNDILGYAKETVLKSGQKRCKFHL